MVFINLKVDRVIQSILWEKRGAWYDIIVLLLILIELKIEVILGDRINLSGGGTYESLILLLGR